MPDDRAAQLPVKIYIKTTVYHPSEDSSLASVAPETYELIVFGQYQETSTAAYLRYQEAMEVGAVNTTVKITEDELLILRSGALKMRMVFRCNKPVSGTYHSPHGYMEIVTEAHAFAHNHNTKTNEGNIALQYDLSMQETLAGTYQLEIKYEEERK